MLKVRVGRYTIPVSAPVLIYLMDFPVDNITINRSVSLLDTYSFSTSLDNINVGLFDDPLYLYHFEAYLDADLIATGIIDNYVYNDSSKLVTFSANDMMYLLGSFAWQTNQYKYNDEHLLGMLAAVLAQTTNTGPFSCNWDLNLDQAYTLDDPVISANVDLTNTGTVLAAVKKVQDSVPNTLIRYDPDSSDAVNGNFFVRVGRFNTDSGFNLTNQNITSLNVSKKFKQPMKVTQPIGKDYTVAGVPTQLLLAGVTVNVIDNFQVYVNRVVNDDIPVAGDFEGGQAVTLYFDDIAPDTLTSPSAAQLNRARRSLYRRAVATMKEQDDQYEWNVGVNEFPLGLVPGNLVTLKHDVFVSNYSQLKQKQSSNKVDALSLEGAFYVKEYSVTYDVNGVSAQLSLNQSGNFGVDNQDVKQFNITKTKIKNNTFFTNLQAPRYGYYTVTLGPGLASNCLSFGVVPGRSVTITKIGSNFGDIDDPPVNATVINDYDVYSDDPNVAALWSSPPTAGVATFTLCVHRNGNWTTADVATIHIFVRFAAT